MTIGREITKTEIWNMIREKCLECVGPGKNAIRDCEGNACEPPCQIYLARLKSSDVSKEQLARMIRRECVSCLGNHTGDICSSFNCALYALRLGPRHPDFNAYLQDPKGYAARKEREYLEHYEWHPRAKQAV